MPAGPGQQNDGQSGENDNLGADIEKVTGSAFNDSLTGSDQRNDLLKEGDETFTVKLLSPQNARLGANSTATATIRDDD